MTNGHVGVSLLGLVPESFLYTGQKQESTPNSPHIDVTKWYVVTVRELPATPVTVGVTKPKVRYIAYAVCVTSRLMCVVTPLFPALLQNSPCRERRRRTCLTPSS